MLLMAARGNDDDLALLERDLGLFPGHLTKKLLSHLLCTVPFSALPLREGGPSAL